MTSRLFFSLQIDSNKTLDRYFSYASILGVEYKPYTFSKTCYGVNEILLTYQTYLIVVNIY